MDTGKIMLIDGNSILNRAFYGVQSSQLLATTYGLYTNAVFGFINILNKYLNEENPDYLCVAFDLKAPTFRHKEFEGYKAKRKGMPGELAVQVPVIKEVLDAMNIKRLEYEGFEADDIIGSVSYCAEQQGLNVVIVTGDKDSLQLASDKTRIKMPITRGGKTETEEYDYNRMLEKYGVTPVQFIDVKGLMGDTSDNIPGVPGIGEKTALDLIKKFNSIEELYENIQNVDRNSVKEKLSSNRELAFMSKRLATIDRNMPELCTIPDLKRGDYDRAKLFELFTRLEFKSFIEKFGLADTVQIEKTTKIIECIEEMQKVRLLKKKLASRKEFAVFYLIDKVGGFSSKLIGAAFSWEKDESVYVSLNGCLSEEDFLLRCFCLHFGC
ncbi:MAG TPA: 5'-3' exonuclease H3TH domain-containing protein, partial [Clostridia bacterium]|nr:5'-3' exonuclease H3TH domain-containing protein [Clostridia bacterium]